MFNILTENIIRYKRDDGTVETASLPQVYTALMNDEVASFPALRPHHRHAWHAFLVQLGAMAMHKADLTEPPADAHEWQRIIRALTPDFPNDEPWQLVVDDITKPAFMQPPTSSEDKRGDYKSEVATPDELDMLVTSKNHDLKAAVSTQGNIDDWLLSLITLQTMEGFGGAGNYGISRMNGGLGSRPIFTLAPASDDGMNVRMGQHIKRDIEALFEHRSTLVSIYPTTESGVGLLWTQSW
ncbi:MAG: CRISPR-associated protein Cse1, partial [Chloroflexi bacterium]|nr:CRISPR-associated protein Cse1 [Chloroflexota bacterium]